MPPIDLLSPETFPDSVKGLAEVLADAVDDDASMGFLAPFGHEDAAAWWHAQAPAVADGSLRVWVCRDPERAGGIVGTVSLALARKPNARHRAEVIKLAVHRAARGRGLARALLATVEAAARASGVTLLMLDTATASRAEGVYLADGWTRYGIVPDYAAAPGGSLEDCSFFYKQLTGPDC